MTPAQLAIAEMLVEIGLRVARLIGVDPPLDRVKEAANRYAAELIPASALALGMFGAVTAAEVSAKIDSLGEDPKCPRCGNVLSRSVLHSPHTGANEETAKCDACGWPS